MGMKSSKNTIFAILLGAVSGFLSGLLGGGGGMIVVPFLIFIMKKPTKIAHATAILIILPVTAVSGIVYAASGYFSLSIGVPVAVGVTVGGAIGALILRKTPPSWAQKIFGFVMLIAGLKMLF